MDKFKPNCTTEITDRILVLEENKRKCVFSNPHALEQLESTIKQLSSTNNILKTAIIVTSRYPSNDTTMQRAKAFFKKKYKVDLLSKNVRMDILIK